MSGPLAGWRVVVTRPRHQAESFAAALAVAGAEPLVLPTIEIADPVDAGDALRAALVAADHDRVVVTSANGADKLLAAVDATGATLPPVAVVGPRTADAVRARGFDVDLVPDRYVAEGLVDAFGEPAQRVLVVRPETARTVIADGLRAAGHHVDEVIAYRTVPSEMSRDGLRAAATAHALTFTSGLTFEAYRAVAGDPHDQVVASIGPVTSAVIGAAGVTVDVEADPHTTDGLVSALIVHRAQLR